MQLLPLQQPAAPGTLPEAVMKAHFMPVSTQAYADSSGPSVPSNNQEGGRLSKTAETRHTGDAIDEAAGVIRGKQVRRGENVLLSSKQLVGDCRCRCRRRPRGPSVERERLEGVCWLWSGKGEALDGGAKQGGGPAEQAKAHGWDVVTLCYVENDVTNKTEES